MFLTPNLRLALEACHEGKSEADEVCYRWLAQKYKDAGVTFQDLKQLERLGYLVRAPGKTAAWYRVVKPLPVTAGG
jgi:hypothetical protein